MAETNTNQYSKLASGFGWKHAALLLLVLFAALFPLYQYIFDIDAIGYITVARHYAAGEWNHAINGYWSPLNSWLMVPLIKLGFSDLLCFKIANIFSFVVISGNMTKDRFLYGFEVSDKITANLKLAALIFRSINSIGHLSRVAFFFFFTSPKRKNKKM